MQTRAIFFMLKNMEEEKLSEKLFYKAQSSTECSGLHKNFIKGRRQDLSKRGPKELFGRHVEMI